MNTVTGRFWTQDEYEGKKCNMLSLHKYLYAQANPVNNIDPSGFDTMAGRTAAQTGFIILAVLATLTSVLGAIAAKTKSVYRTVEEHVDYETVGIPLFTNGTQRKCGAVVCPLEYLQNRKECALKVPSGEFNVFVDPTTPPSVCPKGIRVYFEKIILGGVTVRCSEASTRPQDEACPGGLTNLEFTKRLLTTFADFFRNVKGAL